MCKTPLRLHSGAARLSQHFPTRQELPQLFAAGEKSAITRAVNEGRDLKFLVRNNELPPLPLSPPRLHAPVCKHSPHPAFNCALTPPMTDAG